ncbi:MAG TPA: autotransporter-associated beta strand repeat-containing protein, partial [Lacipirellulaceae bacterium]|nr:autotransporter-associated beta strand repeat-containing protein [Lacipirellulaceae bacterium]
MKRFTALVAATLVLAMTVAAAQAQQTLYWDNNGPTAGFVTPGSFGDGTWDSGTTSIWTTDPTGQIATTTWNDAASPANNAVINVAGASGTNGSGWVTEDAGITIATGTRTAGTLTIGDAGGAFQWVVPQGGGTVSAPNGITILANTRVSMFPTPNFLGAFAGIFDSGTGNLTINSGAMLDINNLARLNAAGKVVLNGGTLYQRNGGSGGSLIPSAKNLEVTGPGTIGYDDGGNNNDSGVSILNGTVITGTGGDPSTGGVGTLIKTGPDQVGYQYKADTGNGQSNAAQNSFAKLKVLQGGFRLRNTGSVVDERLFGAVPTAPLADAITLDGGGIGTNQTVTLHANRGITILNSAGNNLGVVAGNPALGGGYFDHGAGANLIIPGSLSGGGNLYIGDPTSAVVNSVGFTLSNTNNVNTFTGGLIGVRGLLQLNSSLAVNSLKDVSGFTTNPANNATIGIATGQTLTVGTGNGSGTWSTVISGLGGFTKTGSGSQTLGAINTYGGDTKVQGGTLQINNADLADAADVYVSTGALFNLNFAGTDTVRSLLLNNVGQVVGTWGAPGSGAANTSAL